VKVMVDTQQSGSYVWCTVKWMLGLMQSKVKVSVDAQ
jgi:hypothetical protein